jgi:hypothetical protein
MLEEKRDRTRFLKIIPKIKTSAGDFGAGLWDLRV